MIKPFSSRIRPAIRSDQQQTQSCEHPTFLKRKMKIMKSVYVCMCIWYHTCRPDVTMEILLSGDTRHKRSSAMGSAGLRLPTNGL